MTKRQYLLQDVAQKMASNWIAAGDRTESQREQTERSIRRIYRRSSVADLQKMYDSLMA